MLHNEYVAVLDSFDIFSTAIRTAGNSDATVANITSDRESADGSIKLSTSVSDFSISQTAKATWQVSGSSTNTVIKAVRRKSTFELEEGSTKYLLKPGEKSRSEYEVHQQNGNSRKLVCTISVESALASSFRLCCDEVVGVRLPVFCFWLVSMVKGSCAGLVEPRSPRSRLFGVTAAPFREISKAFDVVFAA